MDEFTAFVIAYRDVVEILTIITAALIAVSSLDDFGIDVLYWLRRLTHPQQMARSFDLGMLDSAPQAPLAILVPAWREHDVILSMLTANQRLLAYKNYHFFVGAYQNDPATISEIERAVAASKHVHLVTVPRDGPTSKADCLNEIASTIVGYEAKNNMRFAGFVLHDSEDLIHPHELALFNILSNDYDFVQLPVFSFSRPLTDLVGGLSMDEFAESHLKDIRVREAISGLVPCAGIAAFFGRDAIDHLMQENRGALFATHSLTEDYDVALRMSMHGARMTFIDAPVDYTIDTLGSAGEPQVVRKRLPIATREFFPNRFSLARRQRARWMLGIVFQGSQTFGWKGTAAIKYFLTRDRKSILTAPLIIAGYFVLLNLFLIELYFRFFLPGQQNELVRMQDSLVQLLLLVNFGFLVWRLFHRAFFTTKVYGLQHGLMSIPRLPIANFVNFFAVLRACRLYAGHRIFGTALVWDKTMHEYPTGLMYGSGNLDASDKLGIMPPRHGS